MALTPGTCLKLNLSFSLCFFPEIRFIKKLEHTWKALVHDGVSAGVPSAGYLPWLVLLGANYLAISSP